MQSRRDVCDMGRTSSFYKISFQLGKRIKGERTPLPSDWLSEQIHELRCSLGTIATTANPSLILSRYCLYVRTYGLGGLHAQPGRLHKEGGKPTDRPTNKRFGFLALKTRLSADNALLSAIASSKTWGAAPGAEAGICRRGMPRPSSRRLAIGFECSGLMTM